MSKFKNQIMVVSFIVGLLFVLSIAGPNSNAIISIGCLDKNNKVSEGLKSLPIGKQIVLSVYADKIKSLDGFSINIVFSDSTLKFISASLTNPIDNNKSFMESQGARIGGFFSKPSKGQVDIVASLVGNDSKQSPVGFGVLVYLTLERINSGNTMVKLNSADLVDANLVMDSFKF